MKMESFFEANLYNNNVEINEVFYEKKKKNKVWLKASLLF